VLEPLHIDQFAAKPDPFYLQASSLLVRRSTAKLDLSTRSQHPMPGKIIRRIGAQQPSYRAMIKWIARSRRNPSIGAYLSRWNRENDAAKGLVAHFICPGAIP